MDALDSSCSEDGGRGGRAGPVAPLQGMPGSSAPDDHVPHSGTPQNPDGGHIDPCMHDTFDFRCHSNVSMLYMEAYEGKA